METAGTGVQLKKTKQRLKILSILQTASAPLCAEEILELAKPEFPQMALTTVYRNLETLAKSGQLHRIMSADGIMRVELITEGSRHRHFLVCTECNKKIPLEDCPLSKLICQVETETGFMITGHNLEFYGYCTECGTKIEGKNQEKSVSGRKK